jgi:molecular chaperone GrpE
MANKRDNKAARAAEAAEIAEGAEAAEMAQAAESAAETGVMPPAEAVPPDVAAQLAELNDKYLRLAAEYDNYRKRTTRERLDLRSRAQGDLVAMLIDALDDLGRVAHLAPEATTARDVIAGVELVERKLLKQLEAAGLERVVQVDVPFDPNVHEAIAQAPATAPEQDHTVAAVFQTGYRFNGQLLRPARVQVRIWAGDQAPDAQ